MEIVRIMCGFHKTLFLLICIGAIMGSCVEVVPPPNAATAEKIKLSNIAAITEGKLERNKRGFLDYLLYGLYEYFDYSDESDSEEDEKYLICRNCTILISQSNNQESPAIQTTTVSAAVPNGNNVANGRDTATPAESPINVPMPSETKDNATATPPEPEQG